MTHSRRVSEMQLITGLLAEMWAGLRGNSQRMRKQLCVYNRGKLLLSQDWRNEVQAQLWILKRPVAEEQDGPGRPVHRLSNSIIAKPRPSQKWILGINTLNSVSSQAWSSCTGLPLARQPHCRGQPLEMAGGELENGPGKWRIFHINTLRIIFAIRSLSYFMHVLAMTTRAHNDFSEATWESVLYLSSAVSVSSSMCVFLSIYFYTDIQTHSYASTYTHLWFI